MSLKCLQTCADDKEDLVDSCKRSQFSSDVSG